MWWPSKIGSTSLSRGSLHVYVYLFRTHTALLAKLHWLRPGNFVRVSALQELIDLVCKRMRDVFLVLPKRFLRKLREFFESSCHYMLKLLLSVTFGALKDDFKLFWIPNAVDGDGIFSFSLFDEWVDGYRQIWVD